MASSNRHWPSLFKSKPCNNNHHHQWQHDVSPTSLLSNPSQKPPYGSSGSSAGGEERTPEPKPRWNPKPEQIRTLEAIFNSGMVNPPRDEIRKIRVQLQEYGQVGDANVFYWFQNRKSRSKHKQRQLHSRQNLQRPPISSTPTATGPVTAVAASSSSSSSSDPSNTSVTSSASKTSGIGTMGMIDLSNSPTNSVNQTYFHHNPPPPPLPPNAELQQEFLLFQPQNQNNPIYYNLSSPDLSLSCLAGLTRPPSGFWNSDLITQQEFYKTTTTTDDDHHHDPKKTTTATTSTAMYFNNFYGTTPGTSTAAIITSTFPALSTTTTTTTTASLAATATKEDNSSSIITSPFVDMLQGVEFEPSGGSRIVVFINEVAFEVGTGNLNVREAFGMEAVLLHSSGLPVIVNDWGVTLQPLQHGASYFLV